MGKIFISYRRADSANMSRRIYDALVSHVGDKNVFRDADTLIKGADFRAGIERFILESDVMLVLIGHDWLDIRDAKTGNRRLDNLEDFVRIEVDMGLRHIETVLPVLVNGASMPSEMALPRRLSGLAFKNAVSISDDNFDADFAKLLKAIGVRQRSLLPFMVIGAVVVVAVVLIGLASLMNNDNPDDITPTTVVAAQATSTDTPVVTPEADISADDARATGEAEAYGTLTALAPTDTPTITQTPSHTPISSSDIQETARAETFATATIAAQAQATVDQATQNAVLTEQFQAGATVTYIAQLSLTPRPTNTPSVTPLPPSATPTDTPDPVELALQRAEAGVTSNDQWETWYPDGFVREFDGVAMVLVPAGTFMMGSTDEDIDAAMVAYEAATGSTANRDWFTDEQPIHEQPITTPFWIDRYEVTNELYGSTGCEQWSSDPDQPRNCISWFDANEFCLARSARLPTEAEWEYAARGVDSLIYPWGDDYDATLVIGEDDTTYGDTRTAPVGSRPSGASWVGALDMSGNVWEWTSSLYENYPYVADDGREADTGNSTDIRRVLRGGSFNYSSNDLRSAYRLRRYPTVEFSYFGFRCVRS